MVHLYFRSLLATLMIILAGCMDSRPTKQEAQAWFTKTYPGITLEKVEVRGDEVIVREFTFTYRDPRDNKSNLVDVEFQENSATGKWEPNRHTPLP